MRQGSEPDKPQQKLPIRRQVPKAERSSPFPSPRMELSFMSNEETAGPLTSEVGPSGSGGGPGNEAPGQNNAQEEEVLQQSENDVTMRLHRRVEMEEINDFMGAAHQGLSMGLHQRVESHNDVQEEEAVQQSAKPAAVGKYELQKRRDWNIFGQYLKDKSPPVDLAHCNGVDVVAFLQHHDQFGKTKVHLNTCPLFGLPSPPGSCECPLRQAWGSLDALVGRLRAAFEENGGMPEFNPFGARVVRQYLRDIRDNQAKARGISYDKKRKRPTGVADSDDHQQLQQQQQPPSEVQGLGLGIGTPTGVVDSDEQQLFEQQHQTPSEIQGLESGMKIEPGGADNDEVTEAPIFF